MVTTAGPVEFTFEDQGTGATNYVAEFAPGLEPGTIWEVDPKALIEPLGGGEYRVVVAEAPVPLGFYRVLALGGIGPVVIGFERVAFQVVEGGTAQPVITFSQPFTGTIRYRVSGKAGAEDYAPLTGEVQVLGNSSVVIPIQILDDGELGSLRDLVLTLESAAGYRVDAGNATTTLTIEENDARWQGSLLFDGAVLGLQLNIVQSDGTVSATLEGSGSGLFPEAAHPVSVVFTDDTFAADCANLPLDASASLMNLPALQDLRLHAMSGLENQRVGSTEVRGTAELITRYPEGAHLNVTNTGTFLLWRPPTRAQTNEVELLSDM
ncbi:MAG: hypothetical protein KJ072_11830 [Verrucomicrobia bacterium]|nr:hypothetical protein [Verrucomicrobiota bacterium]